jgi:hypothetical protein
MQVILNRNINIDDPKYGVKNEEGKIVPKNWLLCFQLLTSCWSLFSWTPRWIDVLEVVAQGAWGGKFSQPKILKLVYKQHVENELMFWRCGEQDKRS